MSKIVRIVVHCTGEPADIQRNRAYYYHLFFVVRNWRHYGYHCIVYQDGTWDHLQKWPVPDKQGGVIDNNTLANGAAGYNDSSMHIAYVGGIDPQSGKPADTRTEAQKATMLKIISQWRADYKIKVVVGHNQLPYVYKSCPCFDARKEYTNA